MAHAAGFTIIAGSQISLPVHARITPEVDVSLAILFALAETLLVVAVVT